jgi:hypothetical protein
MDVAGKLVATFFRSDTSLKGALARASDIAFSSQRPVLYLLSLGLLLWDTLVVRKAISCTKGSLKRWDERAAAWLNKWIEFIAERRAKTWLRV